MSQKENWSGEKIRTLRLGLGWSQAEFARRLGCRQQTVSEWETNVYIPQNAYSQLLDRIYEEAMDLRGHVAQVPQAETFMKNMKVSQISKAEIEQSYSSSNDSSFDSFID